MLISSIDNFRNINFPKNQKNQQNIHFASNNIDSNDDVKKFLNKGPLISKNQKAYLQYLQISDPAASEQSKLAHQLARKYVIYKNNSSKTGTITKDHYYLAYLRQMYKFAFAAKAGEKSVETETRMVSPGYLAQGISPHLWKSENADKVLECLREEIIKKTKELEAKSTKNGFVSSLEVDDNLIKNVTYMLQMALQATGKANTKQLNVNDAFMISVLETNEDKDVKNFLQNMSMKIMTKKPSEKDVVLPYYDGLSRQIIKNLDKNYDTYINYSKEDDNALNYFVNNLVANAQNEDFFKECKNLKKENTTLTVFNEAANFKTIIKEMQKMSKEKDKQHIVVLQTFDGAVYNSKVGTAQDGTPLVSEAQVDAVFKHKPKNVHFVFIDNRDSYYNVVDAFERELKDFQSVQIPIMDTAAVKSQLLKTQSKIEEEIGMKLEPEAIEFACDVSASQNGSRYDNALRFLKNAASYYIADESVLKKEHISSYWENTKRENLGSKDGSYDIIFDTKMTTDDIIGSPMVKQQAFDAAYEIKNFPKTKGYVLYSSNGEGGGRYNCAKAIAGEAGIPMVTINAADFAIRDLDTINSDPMEAIDIKISKLINLVKTQAQANPNKTAMLFISNFDRFGSNPLYGISSTYEQQAFKKLLAEMKKAQVDKTYNIVVMGSSDMPEAMDENIRRPGLFMDEIIIYPPQTKKGIKEIALHHAQQNGYDFYSETKEEQEEVLDHLATILKGASYIDIVDIIDKANMISKRNGQESITIENLNEAFLEKLTGPTNELVADNKQKELIIRHEGGHALNLQFMYNILKEKGDTLRIPDSISNIALDPRGDFLGCVFHDNSDENTTETNLETIFSDIVCSFGGNSAEEFFYNQEGSWGISQDRRNANYLAKSAVLHMGLGAHMGHYIPDFSSDGLPVLNSKDEKNYSNDVKVLLKNAKTLSDKIIKCYSGFLEEFSAENLDKFATGKCIITGPQFAKKLQEWENAQPVQKKKEIYELKKEAYKIIECTRESKNYKGLNKFNPKYRNY